MFIFCKMSNVDLSTCQFPFMWKLRTKKLFVTILLLKLCSVVSTFSSKFNSPFSLALHVILAVMSIYSASMWGNLISIQKFPIREIVIQCT